MASDGLNIEALKIGEIAELLGIAPGTVKSRLHHAKRRLKRKLLPIGAIFTPVVKEECHGL